MIFQENWGKIPLYFVQNLTRDFMFQKKKKKSCYWQQCYCYIISATDENWIWVSMINDIILCIGTDDFIVSFRVLCLSITRLK